MRLPLLASLLAFAISPAFGQGQVNVYNWSDYIAEAELKAFEKDSGIKVNYTTYDSNEILEAKLRAGRSGYDVVVPTASPFFVRQLAAGLYKPLDKARLKNLKNLDPEIMAALARYDPGNAHGIPWMWGTTGIGYNVAAIKKRMADAPVDSLKMIFDPAIVSKFADCGVMVLDSATDVFPAALKYLGLDPDSKKPEDLAKAADVVKAVRPFIRKFHSSEYINALAGGDVCLAFGYSGDIFQARDRGAKAKDKQDIAYAIPREGSLLWIDVAAIPKDAPNADNALRFLDFMLEPKVAAASSELTGYANANLPATALLPKDISGNPLIYPPANVRATFYTITAGTAEQTRERTRLWTTVKTDDDLSAQPIVSIAGVSKRFGTVAAVDGVDLEVRRGELFALLGGSGCGKTTLLRMIAGFETPDTGRILIDGQDMTGVPPHRRPVNMMFQSYALFPHMDVAENVGYGLRREGLPSGEIARRVGEALDQVRLGDHGKRPPAQLSGGQRQRVALARALIKRPKLLLLDEPLAALDRKLREGTRFELVRLQEQLGLTFVMVTHDQEEAMSMAGRLAVMNEGRIVQVGTPHEVYEHPRSRFVADFIGIANILPVDGGRAWLALRPEKIALFAARPNTDHAEQGRIVDVAYEGDRSLYRVGLVDGSMLLVSTANVARAPREPWPRGQDVWLGWADDAGQRLDE